MQHRCIHLYKKVFLIIFFSFIGCIPRSYSQQAVTIQEYIDTYRTVAMQEMRRYGIPASIKLAQGILESSFGNSELARNANNHFGIKCHGWPGRGYLYDDDARNECFRVYDDALESYLDHSQFLLSRPRYADLFDMDPLDYKAWAHGLRKAGYATNPNYPAKLIRVIEEHRLMTYDRWAMDLTAELPQGNMASGTNGRNHVQYTRKSNNNLETITGTRVEARNNRIRYVVARRGDTPESLAKELGMWPWQITRYNELEKNQQVLAGQFIYLQPKRRRGPIHHHFVRQGETMYIISQQYGIKLDDLYKRNNMVKGQPPVPGQKILLRGRVR